MTIFNHKSNTQSKSCMLSRTLGFTLVEMMVSLSIFALVTTLVLVRNADFNSSILFSNLAYEIALSIREMQTYGITVKSAPSGGSFAFQKGYGAYFDKVASGSSNVYSFVQFVDTDNNRVYDLAVDEKLATLKLKPGYSIVGLKANSVGVDSIAISFVRPEPKAIITANNGALPNINQAVIMIRAPGSGDIKKCVVVNIAGQISVQDFGSSLCI